MNTITIEIPESQLVGWVRQLSPEAKQKLLQALVPELDRWEVTVKYGEERIRALCAERGLDWDALTDEQRERLVDTLLHEN
jgi:hypothetical protein